MSLYPPFNQEKWTFVKKMKTTFLFIKKHFNFLIYKYIYISIYLSIYLSIYIYIYIHIYYGK